MHAPGGESKAAVRRWARSVRETFSDELRDQKSGAIIGHLVRHPVMDRVRRMMVFSAVHNEVDLGSWVDDCIARDIQVAYPRTIAGDKQLEPRLVRHRGELIVGTWGILEPTESAPLVSPDRLDAVIVPALAFDRRGYRVGYGGGYYDRFLPKLRPDALTIGVVYQELLMDQLPRNRFDVPVDWVITDDGVIHAAHIRAGSEHAID